MQLEQNPAAAGGKPTGLPVSNFHSEELTEVGGPPQAHFLLALTMGWPGFFFCFSQEYKSSLGVPVFSPNSTTGVVNFGSL